VGGRGPHDALLLGRPVRRHAEGGAAVRARAAQLRDAALKGHRLRRGRRLLFGRDGAHRGVHAGAQRPHTSRHAGDALVPHALRRPRGLGVPRLPARGATALQREGRHRDRAELVRGLVRAEQRRDGDLQRVQSEAAVQPAGQLCRRRRRDQGPAVGRLRHRLSRQLRGGEHAARRGGGRRRRLRGAWRAGVLDPVRPRLREPRAGGAGARLPAAPGCRSGVAQMQHVPSACQSSCLALF
jgi:hypothetical protein